MTSRFNNLPRLNAQVQADHVLGPFDWWRHTLGHGGINSRPLPDRVVKGARKLRPRLLRTFIQQYHDVYPAPGRFDWSRLDPYMDSLAATGAQVVAAITLKPPCLFPEINQYQFRPTDQAEWQEVIAALVRRYSVERPIVTHWEIGNETDIGEHGGSPFLITAADDYFEYYRVIVEPIRRVFPQARVGGPALASVSAELLPGFLARCAETGTPLDFVSWHHYGDDPAEFARQIRYVRALLAAHPSLRPELFLTEWSTAFDPVSVEEMAFEPGRAARVAATLLTLMEEQLDWSFYYHVWDQTNYFDDFAPFFRDPTIMTVHWNERPHRFGMFGVGEEVRPQYFVYQMLSRMGTDSVAATSDTPAVRVHAARHEQTTSVLLVNHNPADAQDFIAAIAFSGLPPGRKQLATHRIDDQRKWDEDDLELLPAERREVDTRETFHCQVYCPAESVTLVILENCG